jgi:hypothetical protein
VSVYDDVLVYNKSDVQNVTYTLNLETNNEKELQFIISHFHSSTTQFPFTNNATIDSSNPRAAPTPPGVKSMPHTRRPVYAHWGACMCKTRQRQVPLWIPMVPLGPACLRPTSGTPVWGRPWLRWRRHCRSNTATRTRTESTTAAVGQPARRAGTGRLLLP